MRNLKRALSLLLSSTMVLGMLVMGGSAAGYKDVDASNDHQEAIEVLQAVGIMTGDQNGNFNPDGSITRNEMAVIMAHLLNLDYDYYPGTNPFTDVPEWAAPYVAACAAEGVVAGIGNGQFGGNQKVTAAQASLMIMKALGYFQNAEDFGTDWQVATIRQASYIDLFDQINASAESALTRAQVAQLVLNGLTSDMVYFTGDKGIQIGDVTVGYKAEYTSKTGTAAKYNALVGGKTDIAQQGQYYIQLGEELYNGDLRMMDDIDAFGRPATTWEYNKKDVGTYVDYDLMVAEYTVAVTGEEMYDVLGNTALRDYELAIYKNSDSVQWNGFEAKNLVRTNTKNLDGTGKGILTQVFVDNSTEEITISMIDTYLAKATSDYNKSKETLTVEVYDAANRATDGNGNVKPIDVADIPAVENYAEGEFMLVTMSDGDIQTVADVEILSDTTVTKFSIGGANVSKITADGVEYEGAAVGYYDSKVFQHYDNENLTDKTYNIYLDQYGYAIGVDLYSGEDNYVFITGYDRSRSNLSIKTATAGAIFLDGTFTEITVNVSKTNDYLPDTADTQGYKDWRANGDPADNHWYTYTTTEKNGETVYTLKNISANRVLATKGDTALKVNSSSVRLTENGVAGERAYGNDDSVYITAETGKVDTGRAITKVTGTYTGVQDIDLDIPALVADDKATDSVDSKPFFANNVFAVYDADLYIIGAVVLGVDNTNTKNYVYALDDADAEWIDGGNYYWSFKGITPEGKIDTFTVKEEYGVFDDVADSIQLAIDAAHNQARNVGSMFRVTYDKDGYIIDAEWMKDTVKGGTDVVYGSKDWGNEISTDLHEVYNMGLANVVTGTTLYRVGRTLYIDQAAWGTDAGLTTTTGCTFIVTQREVDSNGAVLGWTDTEYTSLQQALDALGNPSDFHGSVSALLNDNGTAEYVVIKSNDNVVVDTEGTHGTGTSTYSVTGVSATTTGGVVVKLNKKAVDTSLTAEVKIAIAAAPGAYNDFGSDDSVVDNDTITVTGAIAEGAYSIQVNLYDGTRLIDTATYTVFVTA